MSPPTSNLNCGSVDSLAHPFGWTAASYFMGLTVAAGLTLALQVLGSWGVVLLLPPLWLLSEHYRAQRERLVEKRLRVEQVETLNTQLERNVGELEEALTRVKRLEGLLPICSHCKKIRDRGDEWHRLERYLADHSDARFTHSVCPGCREEHFSPAMVQRDIEES